MIIGIDALNLRNGGGTTHLINILSHYQPQKHNIDKIIIWARSEVLDKIDNYDWLEKKTNRFINGNLLIRYAWFTFRSKKAFSKHCDILYSPGGLYYGSFTPFVTMSRNMLLFDKKEQKRLGFFLRVKILLSSKFQIQSLKKASGVIFISDYAKKIITDSLNLDTKLLTKISHGISDRFRVEPSLRHLTIGKDITLQLLYTSHIYEYKHPWNVVEALKKLSDKGYNFFLKIVGSGDEQSIRKLNETITKCDPDNKFVKYYGLQPYATIDEFYKEADIFVYASTCENMPNILIEAMSAALPIACSKSQPMPEFLKDAGVYFDAENIDQIADAIEKLFNDFQLRKELGVKAYIEALQYNWTKTTEDTFAFIENVYINNINK